MRVVTYQNADGVFLLGNGALKVGYLRICGVENLLGLKHIELCGNAPIKSELRQFDGIGLRVDRLSCDLELKVQLQESEVVTRQVADEGQNYYLPRIFCCQ